MSDTYTITGRLEKGRFVTLDEEVPLSSTCVEVVLKPLVSPGREGSDGVEIRRSHAEVIAEIRARQRARGHVPPTKEEIDAYLQGERDSWDD